MFTTSKAALLPLVVAGLLAGIPSAQAETPSVPLRQRSDPSDANAAVPAADYRSVFGQYERRNTDPPIPWKSANDEVARIGGWRAYAREASGTNPANDKAAAPPPASDANASAKPAQGGHAGHQMK